MKIGVTTLYAHRTIVYFAAYIRELLEKDGHSVSALVCDASLPMCHSRLSKGTSRVFECSMCVAGGLRSFPFNSYFGINKNRASATLSDDEVDTIVASSIYTIERVETIDQMRSDHIRSEKRKLYSAARIVYQNTLDWIERDSLDLVYCYNGRMDITRAVMEACKDNGTKFVSFERPWNGFGIQFVAEENCMSLTSRVEINRKFSEKPLTAKQTKIALNLAAMRVSQSSITEWRTYTDTKNKDIVDTPNEDFNVLLLPSSRSEFLGAGDFDLPWGDFTSALESLISRLGVDRKNIALKTHPVWRQDIAKKGGHHILEHYEKWTKDNDVRLLDFGDAKSTSRLIENADLVVVGGSTVAIDAALAGKKVVLLGRAVYEGAGFVYQIRNESEFGVLAKLDSHDSTRTRRAALRFLYTTSFRFPFFSDCVVPDSFFQYRFSQPDLDKPTFAPFVNGVPWDDEFAEDESFENEAIKSWLAADKYPLTELDDFMSLESWEPKSTMAVKRRLFFRSIDSLRQFLPRGDKMRGILRIDGQTDSKRKFGGRR